MILLGVDGGGSCTRAVAVDAAGELQGAARFGCGNYQTIGSPGLQVLIRNILQELDAPVDCICVGLAGAGRLNDQEEISDLLRRKFGIGEVIVRSDAQVALAGAHAGDAGLIVISGTGSIVLGRDVMGREARAGGWGPVLGDEGSGYAIALAALRAVLALRDGTGRKTELHTRLLAATGLAGWGELIPAVYGGEYASHAIAALCPVVFACAGNGDEVAKEIINGASVSLGRQVAAVVRALGFSGHIPICCVGGVFAEIDMLWNPMVAAAEVPGVVLHSHKALLPAVLGAVLLAANLLPDMDPVNFAEALTAISCHSEGLE